MEYNGLNLGEVTRPIAKNILETVGNTPLVRLNNLTKGVGAEVIVKIEAVNPAGSVKDRLALALIDEARQKGLKQGGSIVIATSGNTGVGLSMVCAVLGYKCVVTMPENMSEERRALMRAYGAEIILTPESGGMNASIAQAEILAAEKGYILINQFDSLKNAPLHYQTTGPEIWRDTNGKVDIFVCGVGTGGTFSGVARYLKEKNPRVQAIAVEPSSSAVLSGQARGSHQIQGIGAGFVPSVLDESLIDEIITVSNTDAINAMKDLAAKEGILSGISSGAAAWAAIETAKRSDNKGKTIVTILPDTGERYLSACIF